MLPHNHFLISGLAAISAAVGVVTHILSDIPNLWRLVKK
jgi:hypothetical protein